MHIIENAGQWHPPAGPAGNDWVENLRVPDLSLTWPGAPTLSRTGTRLLRLGAAVRVPERQQKPTMRPRPTVKPVLAVGPRLTVKPVLAVGPRLTVKPVLAVGPCLTVKLDPVVRPRPAVEPDRVSESHLVTRPGIPGVPVTGMDLGRGLAGAAEPVMMLGVPVG
jgi:hypothetical protein